jgi:hypothetical protein
MDPVEKTLAIVIAVAGTVPALWALLFPGSAQRTVLRWMDSQPWQGRKPFLAFLNASYCFWIIRLVGLFGICLFVGMARSLK